MAVLGPTGSGKTRVALELARRFAADMVVADSRQVYRGLDLGSNKPPEAERDGVVMHMIDVADPRQPYSVADYVGGAREVIEAALGKARPVVLEGGTMLYVNALLDGYNLAGVPPRPQRRRELQALPLSQLTAMLGDLDAQADVDLRNPVRVVRAIEVLEVLGGPLGRLRRRNPPGWQTVRLGIHPDWGELDRRLARRSEAQLKAGLVREAAAALAAGVPADAPALTGIGHSEAVAHLRGELPEPELLPRISQANRRYARRQMTWLRRDSRIRWFPMADPMPGILKYLDGKL